MWTQQNEAPNREKNLQIFKNWPSYHNFCSPLENSEKDSEIKMRKRKTQIIYTSREKTRD